MRSFFQAVVSGLVTGSLYALMTVGMTLIYGTLRTLNMALGAMVLVGGYVSWMLFSDLGWGPLAGLVAAAAVTFVVRQEHESRAVRSGVGQRERDVPAEEGVGRLNENARAVAGVGFAATGAAMFQIDQDVQRLAHDVVRALALHVHDEPDAAGVAFVPRVVQTLRGRGQAGIGAGHGPHIVQFGKS